MPRQPDIGNVALYPNRPLRKSDRNGYVLKFYCPLRKTRVRKNCGTRNRREAVKIQRECQKRLHSGEYVASGGAITQAKEEIEATAPTVPVEDTTDGRTWDEAVECYRQHYRLRQRRKSNEDACSRLDIAGRIFESRRAARNLPPGATLQECTTLEAMHYLQNQLLDGAESRYPHRSPNTVNSMLGAIMAFVRYCHDHEWIGRVPPVKKLKVDEVMRGRPISEEEFSQMLAAVPRVVGEESATSWKFVLKMLWESGFRIGDLMDFSWDDTARIHPVWPSKAGQHPTIKIPSSQKNGKAEEIPMLPGVKALLQSIPEPQRTGFVANPLPIVFLIKTDNAWFKPSKNDLLALIQDYSNVAIGEACGVSDPTIRKWCAKFSIERTGKVTFYGQSVPSDVIEPIRKRSKRPTYRRTTKRMTAQSMSNVICAIGEAASVVVRQPDEETGQRIKYASAHDLRRSVAERLINAGVSAETLMVIMRHRDFATTQKFYGAIRKAQSAAGEIHRKLSQDGDVD